MRKACKFKPFVVVWLHCGDEEVRQSRAACPENPVMAGSRSVCVDEDSLRSFSVKLACGCVAGTCGSVNAMEHQLGWYREMTFAPCRAGVLLLFREVSDEREN